MIVNHSQIQPTLQIRKQWSAGLAAVFSVAGWMAYKNGHGYGLFKVNNRSILVQVLMWTLEETKVPENQPKQDQIPICCLFVANLFEEQQRTKQQPTSETLIPKAENSSRVAEEEMKAELEQKSGKKKRKGDFVIDERLLTKEKYLTLEERLERNAKKFTPQYTRFVSSLKNNDFSVFYDKNDKEGQTSDTNKPFVDYCKDMPMWQKKPKTLKKKQLYMPTVVKSLRSELKEQSNNTEHPQPQNGSQQQFNQDSKRKKYQVLIAKHKKKIEQLDKELNRRSLTEQEFKDIRKQKKKLYKKLLSYQQLQAEARFKSAKDAKEGKEQTKLENIYKNLTLDYKLISTQSQKKTETQYQKHLQKEAEKAARKKRLLEQEEQAHQRKLKFEEQLRKSANAIHSVSNLQDEMRKRGYQQIKKIRQAYQLDPKSPKSPEPQTPEKPPKPAKPEEPPRLSKMLRRNEHEKRQKRDKLDKYRVKDFKQENPQPDSSNYQQTDRNQQPKVKQPKWKQHLQKITGYDPRSQKFRDRDKEDIQESGFSQIEKEDKISRLKAREEERAAELNGEIDEV